MSALIYRRAFSDSFGLSDFSQGRLPRIEEVKRRIFLAERRAGPDRPDHFYKNYLAARLGRVRRLGELPSVVLDSLADRFVERSGGTLRIKSSEFEDWRQAVPLISPLAVSVAYLVKEGAVGGFGDPRGILSRELGDSALLGPHLPLLEAAVAAQGLNEMHMHLNGSTEIDIIWADAVRYPKEYLVELRLAEAKNQRLAREFYDQIELGLKPTHVFKRLRSARRVRYAVTEQIARVRAGRQPSLGLHQLLRLMDVERNDVESGIEPEHPLSAPPASILWGRHNANELVEEAAWISACLIEAGRQSPIQELVGLGLYYSLLVHGQIAQISVQQIDEVGFDQFQKYTVVGVRERLERSYEKRFKQLNIASPHRVISHLEGRFAPKSTVAKTSELLNSIVQGWLLFRGCPAQSAARGLRGDVPSCLTGPCQSSCSPMPRGRDSLELALVAHFIKRRIASPALPDPECRDGLLRVELMKQAQVLSAAIRSSRFARQLIRGMDAAANELDAAPEVFAPIFRYLRRNARLKSTFHVGEDFLHLLSGIRAAEEAIVHVGVGFGDRVGHATAIGISPILWMKRTGSRVMLPRGEHLDNCVFARHHLSGRANSERVLSNLDKEIAEHSRIIYGRALSHDLLHEAWKLRAIDILEVLRLERERDVSPGDAAGTAAAAVLKADSVTSQDTRSELLAIADAAELFPLPYEIYRARHRAGSRLDDLVEISTNIVDASELSQMQDSVLREFNRNEIVIETLPTSNVRISSYYDLSEHHIFRWLGLTGEPLLNRPLVCVGSDDTGIFATNIKNEYAALIGILEGRFGKTCDESMDVAAQLNANGWRARFAPIRS